MSDKQPDMLIPQLKAGALVNVTLGGAFIAKIQSCFENHILGHKEELEGLKLKTPDQYANNLTPWEETAVMLSTLMQEIMRIAEKDGLIEHVSLTDTILRSSPQEDSDHS